MITAEQSRAGRALIDWSQSLLAERSRIAKKTIADFERGNRSYHPRTSEALEMALESGGVVFIPENDGGVGVRLRGAMPRFFRRDRVDGRDWVAFAFDYKAKRHLGFVPYAVLHLMALDRLELTEIFDRDRERIMLAAAKRVDAGKVDERRQIHLDTVDLPPVEFDTDEQRAAGDEDR